MLLKLLMDYIPKCPLVIAFTTCAWKHTSGVRVQPKGLLSTSFVILTYCRTLIRITLNCWKKCSNISQIQAWLWLVQLVCEWVVCAAQCGAPAPPGQSPTVILAVRLCSDQNASDKYSANFKHAQTGQKWSFQMWMYKVVLWAETQFRVCLFKGHTSRCWFWSPRRLCGCVHRNHEDWILIFTVPPPGRHTFTTAAPRHAWNCHVNAGEEREMERECDIKGVKWKVCERLGLTCLAALQLAAKSTFSTPFSNPSTLDGLKGHYEISLYSFGL